MYVKVQGENRKHKVLLYALSTCPWCKHAKSFLKDNKIEYEYVDVDLSRAKDREQIRKDIVNRGGRLSYPVIIVDDRLLINGFQKETLREVLEI
jgi:glutaredoxin